MIKPLAWCIARVCINRVTYETIEGREFIRKERSPFSWILILLGNCVFRFRSAPVRVLYRRQWQQWETEIHKTLGTEAPAQTLRGLLQPKISGKPLCEVFGEQGDQISFDDAIDRLSLALQALYRLHRAEIVVDGVSVLVSHGDASVTNAIIADDKKSATWLDFDLRHDLRTPAHVRHADDLRAFMNTGAMCLGPEKPSKDQMDRYWRTMKQAYPNAQTWQQLEEASDRFGNAIDVFALAQMFRGKIACRRNLSIK